GRASRAGPGSLRLWDTGTGRVRDAPWVPRGHVVALRLSPDGNTLAASYDTPASAGVQLWDLATGQEQAHLGVERHVLSLAFPPDGRTLVCGGHEAVIRRLDVASGKQRGCLRAGDPARVAVAPLVHSLTIAPDGRTLAAAVEKAGTAHHAVIRLWDL